MSAPREIAEAAMRAVRDGARCDPWCNCAKCQAIDDVCRALHQLAELAVSGEPEATRGGTTDADLPTRHEVRGILKGFEPVEHPDTTRLATLEWWIDKHGGATFTFWADEQVELDDFQVPDEDEDDLLNSRFDSLNDLLDAVALVRASASPSRPAGTHNE